MRRNIQLSLVIPRLSFAVFHVKEIKIEHMILQYIIIGIVIFAAILYAVQRSYKSVNDNIKCKDYKCAGCAFYDKCRNKQKK